MRLQVNLNSNLSSFVDDNRGDKCMAWYITKCIQFCKENNIDVHKYYEVLDERVEETDRDRKS